MNPKIFEAVESIQREIDQISLGDVSTLSATTSEEFSSHINGLINKQVNDHIMADRIRNEYFGLGPLEELISDPDVTEIVISSFDSVGYERRGILGFYKDSFLTNTTYTLFVRRLCHEAGVELSYVVPFVSGRWRDFRVQITSQPITEFPVINLRRVRQHKWPLSELKTMGMLSNKQEDVLLTNIKLKKNILIIGNTGSGKTTLINSVLGEIAPTERVLIIEDTNELVTPNKLSNKMLTRFDPQNKLPNIDQSLLVQQALRMRPDRIVVGEVRGAEAKDLILALSTGHGGGLGTLHAEDAKQALLRLEMLVSLGAPQWSTSTIRQMIRFGLDMLVVARRHSNGDRRVEGIYQITSLEEFGLITDQIA